MSLSPDVVQLAAILLLPVLGTLAVLAPDRLLFRREYGLAAAFGLAAVLALGLAWQTASDAAFVWNAGVWLSLPGRVPWHTHWAWLADPIRLTWAAAILAVGGVSLLQRVREDSASWSRPQLAAVGAAHAACAAQWLAAEPWLMLLCHTLVGVSICVALGSDRDRFSAGSAARKWYLTGLIGDAFLVAAVILLLPVTGTSELWSSSAALAALSERSPPLPGVVGAALVVGCLARTGLWPFNDWLHAVAESASPRGLSLIATAAWPSGICWLVTAGPWLLETPAARLLATGLGLLTAVTAACFALSQPSPRRMIGWLLASGAGLIAAAMALDSRFAISSSGAGLGLMSATAWLRLSSPHFDRGAAEPRRSGWSTYVVALAPASVIVAGVAMLTVDRTVSPLPLDPAIIAAAAGLAIALQSAAACVLARRMPLGAGFSPLVTGAVLPLGFWSWWEGQRPDVGTVLTALGMIGAAVLIGVVAVVTLNRARQLRPADWDLTRLSRQRLHVDGLVFLLINVPLRALAQLCRFLEWFVLENLVVGQLSKTPLHAGQELRRLQTGQATFYALAAVMATGGLLVTLLWLRA